MSSTDSFESFTPIEVASKIAAYETDISALNVIFGWCSFACSLNWLTTPLLLCKRQRLCRRCSVSKRAVCWRLHLEFALQISHLNQDICKS